MVTWYIPRYHWVLCLRQGKSNAKCIQFICDFPVFPSNHFVNCKVQYQPNWIAHIMFRRTATTTAVHRTLVREWHEIGLNEIRSQINNNKSRNDSPPGFQFFLVLVFVFCFDSFFHLFCCWFVVIELNFPTWNIRRMTRKIHIKHIHLIQCMAIFYMPSWEIGIGLKVDVCREAGWGGIVVKLANDRMNSNFCVCL